MPQADNWGWKARIGMFIVGNECVPEAEWWAMAPSGVSVHAARVTSPTPWARWLDDGGSVELEDDVAHGAAQFAAMRLNAVVIGHSSSSIVGGQGWDDAVVRRLTETLAPETIATTNGLDCQAALSHLSVKRPFLVFPAWYNAATVAAGIQYFDAHGFKAAGHLHFDPGPYWRTIPSEQHYAKGLGFEQDIEELYRQIRGHCPDNADGVLIVGTGGRCVGIIEDLEQDLARPVIAANQASLWNCLRLGGVKADVSGYGQLLKD